MKSNAVQLLLLWAHFALAVEDSDLIFSYSDDPLHLIDHHQELPTISLDRGYQGIIEIDRDSGQLRDQHGRMMLLRGVNLGANSKLPSWVDQENSNNISFVDRPFPLSESAAHLERLRRWGFNTLRLLVPWEAIQHEGPDKYDYDYFEYLLKVLRQCHRYGFRVVIDPHQDVWSRHSGGSGAPRWTFAAAGMDLNEFEATLAAVPTRDLLGSSYPKMAWSSNNNRAAAAVMFTLFFGGDKVAPLWWAYGRQELGTVQEYLQSRYIKSYALLAKYLATNGADLLDSVVLGYDSMNEPSPGYLGVKDLSKLVKEGGLLAGPTPSPYESMRLCSGLATSVAWYRITSLGPLSLGRRVTIDPVGRRCWLRGLPDLFQSLEIIDRKGRLLRPNYFSLPPGTDWLTEYWKPFAKRFIAAIRQYHSNAILFAEPTVMQRPPPMHDIQRIVYTPHWYDGKSLIFRKQSCFNVNALQQQRTGSVLSNLLIGQWCIRRSFRDQMAQIKDEGWQFMSAPTLIGETGISWDFDDDPRQQPVPMRAELWQNPAPSHLVLDNTLQALDWNVMSYTLWNYNPSNRGRYQGGDEWNGEDFSIYTSEHDNTRFLVAVRPYPVHAFGEVLWMEFHPFDSSMKFKMALRVHAECRRDSKDPATTTVLFVPKQVHYRNGVDVSVSVSAREIQQKISYSIHDEEQLYHFCFHQPGEYFIELKRR